MTDETWGVGVTALDAERQRAENARMTALMDRMKADSYMQQRVSELADRARKKYAGGALYGLRFDGDDIAHVWALVHTLDRQLDAARTKHSPNRRQPGKGY
jgi:hypothetical protein